MTNFGWGKNENGGFPPVTFPKTDGPELSGEIVGPPTLIDRIDLARRKWLTAVLFLLVGIVAGAFLVPYLWPGDIDRTNIEGVPAVIPRYSEKMADAYAQAATKAKAGEFKDIVEAMNKLKPEFEKAKNYAAVGTINPLLETINGTNWDDDKAAAVFSEISEGFKKWSN